MIEKLTEQEKLILERKSRVSRMTNLDLFDAYEHSIVSACGGVPDSMAETWALQEELERRLQRIGFLPPTERLQEIRKARAEK